MSTGLEEHVALSAEQTHALQLVKSGENVFFTGPAGTGKSVLLRTIIEELISTTHDNHELAVTAPTGIAALNIGGTTIHSFAGIGLGKEKKEILAKKIKNSLGPRERWSDLKTLIIDEISMVDGELFDKLEYIARVIKKNPAPFGGIQLILCGDFFQLPPVPDKTYKYHKPAVQTFDAKSWSRCISRPIFLTQVFRQRDPKFIQILTNMRHGMLNADDERTLRSLSRRLCYPDGIEPSRLFPLRRDVESCNNTKLEALPGDPCTFSAMDFAGYDYEGNPIDKSSAERLLDRINASPVISLKVGAQVMLIQNVEQGTLVNGSQGLVIDFMTVHDAQVRGVEIAEQTTRRGRDDVSTSDMGVSSSADLRPLNSNVFRRQDLWPLVKFENGRELLCQPLNFTVEGFMGNVEARRMQVPLILSWALSIHKSQGQTLTRVKIDLEHIFEKGQAYVAVSRATSMDNLEIMNFQSSKVLAHPRVIAWHRFWSSFGPGELPEELRHDIHPDD